MRPRWDMPISISLHAAGRAGFEDGIEEDHGTLAAFIGKPFFTEESFPEEILEGFRFEHPAQGAELLFR